MGGPFDGQTCTRNEDWLAVRWQPYFLPHDNVWEVYKNAGGYGWRHEGSTTKLDGKFKGAMLAREVVRVEYSVDGTDGYFMAQYVKGAKG